MSYSTEETEYNEDEGGVGRSVPLDWLRRNNSSNVSAVLNSELNIPDNHSNFLQKIKKPVIVSNHCSKKNPPVKYCYKNCYCTRAPVYPKIPLQMPEEQEEKLKVPRVKNVFYSEDHYLENEEALEKNDPYGTLRYTTPRQVYENFKIEKELDHQLSVDLQPQQQDFVDSITSSPNNSQKYFKARAPSPNNRQKHFKARAPSPSNRQKYFKPTTKKVNSPTLPQTSKRDAILNQNTIDYESGDKPSPSNSNYNADLHLKKLNTFRKNNLLECYSTGDIGDETMANHKCVYKFVLNDRLIPQPLHADVFGVSRCAICNKPIKPERANSFEKQDNSHQTKAYKSPVSYTNQINIGTKNDRIELKVPFSLENPTELFNTYFKVKNPLSANSLALRYQKGVV